MTSDSLLNALEICLQALDQGADLESCLVRYPALADELRPILVTALQARAAAVTEIPADVTWRSKLRVLHAAEEMRKQQIAAPVQPAWRKKGFFGPRFYRLAVTTALVIAFLLTGGTGLVNASSGALPGDSLYPVKRGWEELRLALVFNQQTKTELEHQFDHERVEEIEELYFEKRFEQVNFQGVVESQQPGTWRISGLNVAIDEHTATTTEINSGATVQIIGETDDGVIKAEQIILIATPGVTPTAISNSTPAPQILQTNAPEEFQTPEGGEDSEGSATVKTKSPKSSESSGKSGNENEINTNSIKTPRPEDEDDSHPIETPRPRRDDHGSEDGSGTDGGESHPPTEEHDEGDH